MQIGLNSLPSLPRPAGDFREPEVALWSSRSFQLLSRVGVAGPLHDVAFSPSAASQLACVGRLGVAFCQVTSSSPDPELQVLISHSSSDPDLELQVLFSHSSS